MNEGLILGLNDIVNWKNISNYDYLIKEALINGLPKTYSGMTKTLLYEYFVRAVSALMSEKWISREEMRPDFEWFKKVGFVRTEEIADLIKENMPNYSSFEELYKNVLIPYLESFCLKSADVKEKVSR